MCSIESCVEAGEPRNAALLREQSVPKCSFPNPDTSNGSKPGDDGALAHAAEFSKWSFICFKVWLAT